MPYFNILISLEMIREAHHSSVMESLVPSVKTPILGGDESPVVRNAF
jgi:hypothetical protein